MKALQISFLVAVIAAPAAGEAWNTPESRARWSELSKAIFGANAKLEATDRVVTIEAPQTAQDAALVPVTIKTEPDTHIKALDFVIDQNPSPLAAKVQFGAAGDPRLMKFRVRVDGFTNMHAVAANEQGKLFQTVVYMQAAGGCSAPVGANATDAAANMGEMRMKFSSNAILGDAKQATLMIRHPNFNGMQMNQGTHALVPPRYIKSIKVMRGDATVFDMDTDISLATNPVIEFLYKPEGTTPLKVAVVDSANATWTKQFDISPSTN